MLSAGWWVAWAVALPLLGGCALGTPGQGRVPDSLTAAEHNDLGVAYHARGEYARAVREFERAVARRPGFSRALANLGEARLALGQVDGALAAYEAARAAAPGDPAIANNLAWALLQHPARWREAEDVIRGALEVAGPSRGYYLDTLGAILRRKGETRAALEAFREALADRDLRDPVTRAAVLRRTGEALRDLGAVEAASRCDDLAGELTARGSPAEAGGNVVGSGNALC